MTEKTLLQRAFIESHVEKLPPNPAIFVEQTQTCSEAIKLLNEHKFGCLLVRDGENPIAGIITERDIVKKLWAHKDSPSRVPVSEIMTPNPQTLKYHASVAKAIYLMDSGGFRHIPVLQRDNSWSIISVTDFIRFIQKKLSERMQKQSDTCEVIVSNSSVDNFLQGELSALKPTVPLQLPESATVEETVNQMVSKNVDCVIIGDLNRHSVSGIFTDRDLVKRVILKRDSLRSSEIQEVMTKSPTTLQLTASVLYALSAMTEGKFRHLPIVDFDEKLVGLLSIRSFLKFLSSGIVKDLQA